MNNTLIHGGQLNKIAIQYGIPLDKWLDLSTGISPTSYPIGEIPTKVWQRLPETSHDLIDAARDYYQCQTILPISGSQSAIQLLPQLISTQNYKSRRVFIPNIGYQEHRKAWKNSVHQVMNYQYVHEIKNLQRGDVVIVINPNNPTGHLYSESDLSELFNKLKQKEGLLIIDEAFMDCTPQYSFIRHTVDPSLIVLRSTGKFFGLAGLRLGFIAATPNWLNKLASMLGPWSVNGPAQFIGHKALTDTQWHQKQRHTLRTLSERLESVLVSHFQVPVTGTALFKTIQHINSPMLYEKLCQQGVYVRLCDEQNALRFGIPTEIQFPQLIDVIQNITT
ncbi:threonine-phosphate decarboxylase CobD [Paraglaciecola sp.]|uniref:threonine-phosphate decarboxylase CobD n=1 Tax=Paraglaciecola sp. TaxID=1920173 RepID=UPI003EF58A9B